jgi:hypothetical protein
VGEALEHLHSANIEPHLAELAHHYLHATSSRAARKAIDYAQRAAQHAADELAFEEAARLYALALQSAERTGAATAEEHAELLIERADQLALAGDVSRSRPALVEAEREAERTGAVLSARATLIRAEIELIDGTEQRHDTLERVHAALAVFQERGDALGEARAWWAVSMRHHPVGRYIEAGAAAKQMLECARRAGSRALEDKALQRIACSLAHGPTPVADAVPQVERMLEQTDHPYARSKLLLYLAELQAMGGRYAHARSLAEESTTLMRELGDELELALGQALRCSSIELWAGDFLASERFARAGCEVLERLGASGYLASLLICIVEALIPQEKLGEASRIMSRAASLQNDPADLDAIERQARARALIALASGDPTTAERSARAALAATLRNDDVAERAANWLVLADALNAAGSAADARDAATRAHEIAQHKGHILFMNRARSIMTENASWSASCTASSHASNVP